jgi:predicted dithiol-disulfide oxidoreductase (DUF899 family)
MATSHHVVSRNAWLAARKELLAEEKKFTHLREDLSEKRRSLPWVKIEEPYVFDGPNGKETLLELFNGKSQLIVYHFMFAPEWEAACKSCTFWGDSFNDCIPHLAARDVSFAAISRAPVAKLQAYAKRMGFTFHWVSSGQNDFNADFGVYFSPEELAKGDATYNYGSFKPKGSDMPGFSVFIRQGDDVFHTYSTYGRGIDAVNPTYQLLDLVPKGRDEEPGRIMAWLRRHDEYSA